MKINRRNFLKSCGLAAVAGATTGIPRVGFGTADDTKHIMLVVFQRGACDGLSLFPPVSGADRIEYEIARPNLQIPVAQTLPLDGQFGLHPAAAPLKALYDQGLLAIVRAVGNTLQPSRSHFDAMALLEAGTPDNKGATSGWLTRYFASLNDLPTSIQIPSVAASYYTPSSFQADPYVLTMGDPYSFNHLQTTRWTWNERLQTVLPDLYTGADTVSHAGRQALTAVDIIASQDFDAYVPANSAVYPAGDVGEQMEMLAQMIKMDVGLRVASLDANGWDTHSEQIGSTAISGEFADALVSPLAQSLAALMADLNVPVGDGSGDTWQDRVTVVVQTEFGRRVRENADNGTDHGYGADILLLGGGVNGGQFYGDWPGLRNDQLFEGMDVNVTTDFRQVLSEVLIRRLENPELGQIFPGYTGYSPIGVVQGPDIPPIYEPPADQIFADGFED